MKEIENLGYTVEEVKEMDLASLEFQDFCYLLSREYGEESEVIDKVSVFLGITKDDIIKKADKYKNNKHSEHLIESNMKRKKRLVQQKTIKFIQDILNTHKKSEVITLLTCDEYRKFKINPALIRQIIEKKDKEKAPVIIAEIEKRLDVYREYLNKTPLPQNSSRQEQNAMRLYEMVMQDDNLFLFKDIIAKYKVSSYTLWFYQKIWCEKKINEKSLYELVCEKLVKNANKHYRDALHKDILKVLPLIGEPIRVGDRERYFDILDCLTYFEGNFNECIDVIYQHYSSLIKDNEKNSALAKKIGILKSIILNKRLFMPQTNEKNLNFFFVDQEHEKEAINTILGLKINYDNKENNLLTMEDKLTIIKELKEYHVPITVYIFQLAVNKYNNGHLELITKDTIDSFLEKGEEKTK